MLPGWKPGATLHADYMEAWVTAGKKLWMDNCIDKGLDCSGGDLGNGTQLIGAALPVYGWRNPNVRSSWVPGWAKALRVDRVRPTKLGNLRTDLALSEWPAYFVRYLSQSGMPIPFLHFSIKGLGMISFVF